MQWIQPAPEFGLRQMILIRSVATQARSAFFLLNAFLIILVLYTSYLYPHKYIRVNGRCESNWLQQSRHGHASPQGMICCNESRHPSPCYALMSITRIFGSEAAYTIPFIPLIFHYVFVLWSSKNCIHHIRTLLRRCLLYLFIMLFRLIVLFKIMNQIEDLVVNTLYPNNGTCWYKSFRRDGKCVGLFDYSDHVVLLVTHYIAIPMAELYAVSVEVPCRWYYSIRKSILHLIIAVLLCVAIYILYFTTLYFHTTSENLLGIAIAQITVMYPLYLLSQDRLTGILSTKQISWLQLRWFVFPPSTREACLEKHE